MERRTQGPAAVGSHAGQATVLGKQPHRASLFSLVLQPAFPTAPTACPPSDQLRVVRSCLHQGPVQLEEASPAWGFRAEPAEGFPREGAEGQPDWQWPGATLTPV